MISILHPALSIVSDDFRPAVYTDCFSFHMVEMALANKIDM